MDLFPLKKGWNPAKCIEIVRDVNGGRDARKEEEGRCKEGDEEKKSKDKNF